MFHFIKNSIWFLSALFFVFGCSKPLEKQRTETQQMSESADEVYVVERPEFPEDVRVSHSLDISGSYAANSDAEAAMEFYIQNEAGPDDIVINIHRQGDLTDQEAALLRTAKLNREQFKSFFWDVQLGHDSEPIHFSRSLPEYENISVDNGQTSLFDVCSDSISFKNGGHHAYVRYCVEGMAERGNPVITGRLKLRCYRCGGENEDENYFQDVIVPYELVRQ